MRQGMFAIFDSKAELYNKPFFSHNRETALREVSRAVNSSDDSHFSFSAGDFVLFEIGYYDDSTCKFDLHESPESLINLIHLKEKE